MPILARRRTVELVRPSRRGAADGLGETTFGTGEGDMAVTTQPAVDQEKVEAFVGKVLGDTSGAIVTVMAAIGDQLGLFKDLAANGPATSVELAGRVGIDERYTREWLGCMASAG